MMEPFRQWLLGVVCCALLVSFLEQLGGSGAMRQILRFTGGLLLLLCALLPVARIDPDSLTWDAPRYREAVALLEEDFAARRESEWIAGIAGKTAAYIEDKADSFGMDVRAEVETGLRDGVPVPVRVTLHGEESKALSDWIERELGITKENQLWTKAG